MAILKMKRIELLAMLGDSKSILDLIQQSGCVEVLDVEEESNDFYKLSMSTSVNQFEKFKGVATQALEILNQYAPKDGGLLDSFAPRPDMTVTDFYKKSQDADAILSKCYGINALYKEIQDAKTEIIRAQTSIDQVMPWANLDIPSSYKGTQFTSCFIGSIGEPITEADINAKLAEAVPEIDFKVETVLEDKNQTCLVAICHNENAKDFEQALRSIGFVTPSDPTKHEPAVRIKRLEAQIEKCNEKIAENEEKIKTYAEFRGDMEFLVDYFTLRTDKYQALDKIEMSDNIFVLHGYVPEIYVEGLTKKLESLFDVAISITDPDPETEEIPVLLDNGSIGQTMESITEMYALPTHNDVDPNKAMAVFYYLLFGLMLGDAGYGILMVIACLIVKFKFRLEPKKAATVNYGLLCGIGTTFWGIVLNGWFGDLPAYLANGLKMGGTNPMSKLSFFEAMETSEATVVFLMICLMIGIIHLVYGLCINIYNMWKHGNKFEAIFENVPMILIFIGFLPLIDSQISGVALRAYATDPTVTHGAIQGVCRALVVFFDTCSKPLLMVLAAGAALTVLAPVLIAIKNKQKFGKVAGGFGAGLYALYNAASGALGDILSYARLLALGLCTGIIASVINQLAAMPGNPILFVIIFVFGHVVNMAINLIGTYVHTNRLQYVELYAKFYEGGGRGFEPLTVNSKSFKFKEEN
ncbi:MAG: V-type ATP synthase subunit I [Oscillospiraceae bacterium]|nr:V-type ATP synthase subunit I [Candidatus Limimonas egerieequi]